MNKKKYPYLWAIIFGSALALYTVFTLLDAFVIPRGIVKVDFSAQTSASAVPAKKATASGPAAASETSKSTAAERQTAAISEIPRNTGTAVTTAAETESPAGAEGLSPETSAPLAEIPEETAPAEPVITDTSYSDGSVEINISTIREYDTYIYIADIKVKNAELLKTGLAQNSFGRNIRQYTSTIARNCGAILAINGDYYGFRDAGFVMRNGYLYRESARGSDQEDLVIYPDGSFEIINEYGTTAAELAENGAAQIFSFGPGLISEGEITVDSSSEVERSMQSNPRTAIGIIGSLHYLFVVSDGRSSESAGLSLLQLAEIMKAQNCVTAYNLDGGGSSTMWFMGNLVNNPTSGWGDYGERGVSDIVYIGY